MSGGIELTRDGSLYYEPQMPSLVLPAGMSPFLLGATGTSTAANGSFGVRCIVPRTGTLRDLSVLIATSSGNIDVGVYDDTATTRNRLWSSGSTASPGTGWRTIGDPQISVVAGQHIDLVIAADNATAAFGRFSMGTLIPGDLPSGFFVSPNGASPKLSWEKTSNFPIAATLSESSMSLQTYACVALIARVS